MEDDSILFEAYHLVSKDRKEDYGDVLKDFTRTSTIWSSLLEDRLKSNLTPVDVAVMMIALKLSRTAFKKDKRDNWVDIAGYAHLADLCSKHNNNNNE